MKSTNPLQHPPICLKVHSTAPVDAFFQLVVADWDEWRSMQGKLPLQSFQCLEGKGNVYIYNIMHIINASEFNTTKYKNQHMEFPE